MNLYQGYCYSDLSQASDAEISAPSLPSLTGVAVPVSFTSLSSESGTLIFNKSDGLSFSVLRVYPSCSSVGYQHNFSGLTLSDATQASWLVFGCLAAVWAIKQIRRGL